MLTKEPSTLSFKSLDFFYVSARRYSLSQMHWKALVHPLTVTMNEFHEHQPIRHNRSKTSWRYMPFSQLSSYYRPRQPLLPPMSVWPSYMVWQPDNDSAPIFLLSVSEADARINHVCSITAQRQMSGGVLKD